MNFLQRFRCSPSINDLDLPTDSNQTNQTPAQSQNVAPVHNSISSGSIASRSEQNFREVYAVGSPMRAANGEPVEASSLTKAAQKMSAIESELLYQFAEAKRRKNLLPLTFPSQPPALDLEALQWNEEDDEPAKPLPLIQGASRLFRIVSDMSENRERDDNETNVVNRF